MVQLLLLQIIQVPILTGRSRWVSVLFKKTHVLSKGVLNELSRVVQGQVQRKTRHSNRAVSNIH